MVGTGNYQRFGQRITILIPVLLSFLFLHRFLIKNKIIHYFSSISLYVIALLMGHFTTFSLPLFFLYPIVYSLLNSKHKIIKSVLLSLSFVFINFFLLKNATHLPHKNIGSLFQNPQKLIEDIVLQIGNINIPIYILSKIRAYFDPFKEVLLILSIPCIIIFILGSLIIAKKLKKILPLYITSLLVIPILLALNLYFQRVNPIQNIQNYQHYFLSGYPTDYLNSINNLIKGDRYYTMPMIFISIIWSSLLVSIFNNRMGKSIIILMLSFYLYKNINLININLKLFERPSRDYKIYLSHIKKMSHEFTPDSIIITPRFFLWTAPLIKTFYGYEEQMFIDYKPGWEEEIPLKFKGRIFTINYDYQKQLTKITIKDCTQKQCD